MTALRFHVTDDQARLVPLMLSERARRELYLHCERAPRGWDDPQPPPFPRKKGKPDGGRP